MQQLVSLPVPGISFEQSPRCSTLFWVQLGSAWKFLKPSKTEFSTTFLSQAGKLYKYKIHPRSWTASLPLKEIPGPTRKPDHLALPSFFRGRTVKLPVGNNKYWQEKIMINIILNNRSPFQKKTWNLLRPKRCLFQRTRRPPKIGKVSFRKSHPTN